jgi:hypothetical protein
MSNRRKTLFTLPALNAAHLVVAAITAMALASTVRADLQVVEQKTDGSQLTIFKMTVTPAAEPIPPFKYRLLPGPLEIRPGNAALHYERAFAENGVAGVWKALEKKYGSDVQGIGNEPAWYSPEKPLKELDAAKLRDAASHFDTIVDQFVARGVIRNQCDWGRNIEELQGLDIISMLLPEIQETRSLSRALMLRTRAALTEGDFDRAIAQLRMNYQLAQHVASDPILICGLVGLAEAGLGNHEMVELIATKDSPNMYWALAELPRSFINMRPATRFELSWGLKIFPAMLDPESQEHSPEEWAALLAKSAVDMQAVAGGAPKLDQFAMQMATTGLALVTYSDAKQRLIAGGMDHDRVEKMPVGQVIAVDASREYRRVAQELEKSLYLPFHLGQERYAKSEKLLLGGNKFQRGYGGVVASLLLPALSGVYQSQVRVDREVNALQVVEAIRLRAAETGELPARLDEIKSVYLPDNPATGKPFQYRLDGDTAVLDLPQSDGIRAQAWRYEIKLVK